jgi:phosphoglycolate phosphatase-like HAD superfamily hydrolase
LFDFDGTIADTGEGIRKSVMYSAEKLGYAVHTGLGNENNRISLAVYDEKEDRYLVGVILDTDAFASSPASMERDVYKPKFLEARGWNLMRVWCRDFWISPEKVVKSIASAAEKAKKKA